MSTNCVIGRPADPELAARGYVVEGRYVHFDGYFDEPGVGSWLLQAQLDQFDGDTEALAARLIDADDAAHGWVVVAGRDLRQPPAPATPSVAALPGPEPMQPVTDRLPTVARPGDVEWIYVLRSEGLEVHHQGARFTVAWLGGAQ